MCVCVCVCVCVNRSTVCTKFWAFLDYLQKHSPLSVLCRVKLNSAFRCTRSNVESRSTPLSAVPGPISSHTRQLFPLFQVQCRVTLDTAFRCSRSNIESYSTALSAVPGPMSSHARQRFPLFQVQCRATLDSVFRCTNSNVSSYRRVIFHCFILIFLALVLSSSYY